MSRLPPPPRGKPPAPEPSTIPSSGDAPPPLPSRPGGKALPKGKTLPPPPRVNGTTSTPAGPDDYIEPDDWTDGGPQAPSLPPRNFDASDGGELYEEPDANMMPPPPVSRAPHKHTPPPTPDDGGGELYEEPDVTSPPGPPPSVSRAPPKPAPAPAPTPIQDGGDGEIYDDLEDDVPPPTQYPEEPSETYDACNFEGQDNNEADEFYQEPELIQDDTYEVMPPEREVSKSPRVPPTPPPVNSTPPRRAPAPAPAPPPSLDNKPDLPQRNTPQPPKAVKKAVSNGPQTTAAISLNELSNGKNRLRKVSSQEVPEPPTTSPTPTHTDPDLDSGSVLAKALKFQDDHQEGDLQNEILNARSALRSSKKSTIPKPPAKPGPASSDTSSISPVTPRPKPPTKSGQAAGETSLASAGSNTSSSISSNRPTSGLSIKERIALMQKSKSPDDQPQNCLQKPVPQARSRSPEPRARSRSPAPTARQTSPESSASRQPLKPPPTPFKPKKVESSSCHQLPQPPTVRQKDGGQQASSIISNGCSGMVLNVSSQGSSSKPVIAMKPPGVKPKVPLVDKPVGVVSPAAVSPTIKSPVQRSPPPRSPSPPPPPPPQYDDGEELYDEGFSYMDPMQGQEWFHGSLDRGTTTNRLKSIAEDGTFLVRKATKDSASQPYTLVVLYQDKEYNLKIRKRDDSQVALGEIKPNEMTFSDVAALVEHHKKHEVILVNSRENKQHQTILKRSPLARR